MALGAPGPFEQLNRNPAAPVSGQGPKQLPIDLFVDRNLAADETRGCAVRAARAADARGQRACSSRRVLSKDRVELPDQQTTVGLEPCHIGQCGIERTQRRVQRLGVIDRLDRPQRERRRR